jgi:pyruvate dehydrogenase E2 component (dihydrolipoamide acetyltransferase)
MATTVIMPKQGLQMTEGTITKWIVKEGEKVEADQPLFEMETDKLNIEITSPASGTLIKIIRGEGETVPVAEPIALIGEPSEDTSADISEVTAVTSSDASSATSSDASSAISEDKTVSRSSKESIEKDSIPVIKSTDAVSRSSGRILISPRARMLAEDNGINISNIAGTGPDGIITENDVRNAITAVKND